jgi:hypothetical protein
MSCVTPAAPTTDVARIETGFVGCDRLDQTWVDAAGGRSVRDQALEIRRSPCERRDAAGILGACRRKRA